MANILPKEYQEAIWRHYRARFILALSASLAAAATVGFLTLLPTYIAVQAAAPGEAASQQETGETYDQKGLARALSIVEKISDPLTATTSPSSIMADVIAQKPAGATVDRLSYIAGEPARLTIHGTAPRDAINAYRAALAKDARFTSVSVPVGALVGTEDGRYTITIFGTF